MHWTEHNMVLQVLAKFFCEAAHNFKLTFNFLDGVCNVQQCQPTNITSHSAN